MFKNFEKRAFSLAEALMVLSVLSVITVALVTVVAKKETVTKDMKQPHGVYECYRMNSTNGGALMERKTRNNIVTTLQAKGGVCVFEPPRGAELIAVQIIGGGGGGSNRTASGDLVPKGGGAGETKTLHFPVLPPGANYNIKIGDGGTAGKPGKETSFSTDQNNLLTARGGISGGDLVGREELFGESSSSKAGTDEGHGSGGSPGKAGKPGAVIITW